VVIEHRYILDALAGHDVFDSTTVTDAFSPVDVPAADVAVGMLRGLSVGIPLVCIISILLIHHFINPT